MITNGGMTELMFYKSLKCFEMSDEYFYSLPSEIQRAIIMAGVSNDMKKRNELMKKMALKQYKLEELTKDKVLTLLKKKGR